MEKRLLCVPSSATHITLKNGKVVETGYFLSELAVPGQIFRSAGWHLTYATANGSRPALDPSSDRSMWFGFSQEEYLQAKTFITSESLNAGFEHPTPLAALHDAELENYAGIFIPGGHGPMVDLADSVEMARVLNHFVQRKKVIASICHGPAAFLSLTHGGEFPFKGYHMTCFSNAEENMNWLGWWSTPQWRLASRLEDEGVFVENSLPFTSKVVVDRNVITAQNPTSAKPFANSVLTVLARQTLWQPPAQGAVPAAAPQPAFHPVF